jgi:hypothetical protein
VSLAPAAERNAVLESIVQLVGRETDADQLLRQAVTLLADGLAATRWVGVAFVEEGTLALGPVAGAAPVSPDRPALHQPVEYDRATVAELWLDTDAEADADDRVFLERVAGLLSPYCLVGWDTGGEAWVND